MRKLKSVRRGSFSDSRRAGECASLIRPTDQQVHRRSNNLRDCIRSTPESGVANQGPIDAAVPTQPNLVDLGLEQIKQQTNTQTTKASA